MTNNPKRKSGLRKNKGDLFSVNETLDLSDFITPYLNFQQDYQKLHSQHVTSKAYIVTFKSDSSLMFVAFAENKDKAKSQATKYFRDSFYPTFMGTAWKQRYNEGRTKRKPEWDIFYKTKKIPIIELMKVGANFPCSSCFSDKFTYEDYKNKRCFIIEDEGDLNLFTKGFVLCYSCYKKLLEK